jgi:Ran GTPase-activating protein 1
MAPPPTTLFSLEGKGLKLDTAADIEAHIKPLFENTSITEIRLGGNTLGAPACERLATALSAQKSLQVANLADIFTSRLLSEIPPALSSLLNALLEIPTLHTVDLSDNAFGLNTQAPLVEFLERHVPLRHLILNNNGLGPNAGTLIANALTKLAERKVEATKAIVDGEGTKPKPAFLETVVCGRNRLENGSMEAWARAYEAHAAGIRVVKMTQNGIRQEGISRLLRSGLRHATGIEVLDLQDNTFTNLGSGALASVIKGWPSLRELGVGDCLLSARGGIRVAQALALGKNGKVEILRFQYNDINGEGLKQITHAANNALPSLKRVELNGNKFDEEDENIATLTELLEGRKEKHGTDDDADDAWGLDELDELEEESEEEEGEEEEEEESEEEPEVEEKKAEKIVKEAEEAETENVAQKKDKEVDNLAAQLSKTEIKS